MAKTQTYKLSQDGLNTTITDTTVWGGVDGNRVDYAVVFGLLKYSTSGFSPAALAGSSPVNILDENPAFIFTNKDDGYYRIRAIYASINSAASVEGAVYYNTTESQLYLYTNGAFSPVSYTQLVTYNGDLIEEITVDVGFSPALQKAIDKIWYQYFISRQLYEGKEYKDFSLLYALFVGANASIAESAFVEYDVKIKNAYKIALRKLKEIK